MTSGGGGGNTHSSSSVEWEAGSDSGTLSPSHSPWQQHQQQQQQRSVPPPSSPPLHLTQRHPDDVLLLQAENERLRWQQAEAERRTEELQVALALAQVQVQQQQQQQQQERHSRPDAALRLQGEVLRLQAELEGERAAAAQREEGLQRQVG